MFRFIKNVFIAAIGFIRLNGNVSPLKYVSMSVQECTIRPEIMNINSNEPFILSLQCSCK